MEINKIEEMLASDDEEMVLLGIVYLEKMIAAEDWITTLEKVKSGEDIKFAHTYPDLTLKCYKVYEYHIINSHINLQGMWKVEITHEREDKTIFKRGRFRASAAGSNPSNSAFSAEGVGEFPGLSPDKIV